MTHDPMCPWLVSQATPCACTLIARVREDERKRTPAIAVLEASDAGYAAGLSDAREAVAALPFVRPAYYGKGVLIHGAEPDFVRGDALAVIDAIAKEMSE